MSVGTGKKGHTIYHIEGLLLPFCSSAVCVTLAMNLEGFLGAHQGCGTLDTVHRSARLICPWHAMWLPSCLSHPVYTGEVEKRPNQIFGTP